MAEGALPSLRFLASESVALSIIKTAETILLKAAEGNFEDPTATVAELSCAIFFASLNTLMSFTEPKQHLFTFGNFQSRSPAKSQIE